MRTLLLFAADVGIVCIKAFDPFRVRERPRSGKTSSVECDAVVSDELRATGRVGSRVESRNF